MLLGMATGDNRSHTWHQVHIAVDYLQHPGDRFKAFSHMAISGTLPFVA